MSSRTERELPGMGISGWKVVLVHYRDNVWGDSEKKLERKNQDMQDLHGLHPFAFPHQNKKNQEQSSMCLENITYNHQKLKIRNAIHNFKPFISSVLLESKSPGNFCLTQLI